MKLVMRSNKQVRVKDERLEDFKGRGFVEVDEKTGQPVNPPEEQEDKPLKKENAALKKENKELSARVAELTARLEQPQK